MCTGAICSIVYSVSVQDLVYSIVNNNWDWVLKIWCHMYWLTINFGTIGTVGLSGCGGRDTTAYSVLLFGCGDHCLLCGSVVKRERPQPILWVSLVVESETTAVSLVLEK